MKILLMGGSKSGKSALALRLATALGRNGLYYIATMKPADKEDNLRINRHVKERNGMGFVTLEQPFQIEKCLNFVGKQDTLLIDSLTALLANEMYGGNGQNWVLPEGIEWERVLKGLSVLCSGVLNTIIVTDNIFCGTETSDESVEMFRRSLGHLNRGVASLCDIVVEMYFGSVVCLKGEMIFDTLCKKNI